MDHTNAETETRNTEGGLIDLMSGRDTTTTSLGLQRITTLHYTSRVFSTMRSGIIGARSRIGPRV